MRVTIKLKLGLAFAGIILLSMVIAGLGVNGLASLNTTLDTLIQGPVQRQQLATRLGADVLRVVRAEKNLVMAENKEQLDRDNAELISRRRDIDSRLEKAEATASIEGKPKWAAFHASWQQYSLLQDKMIDLALHGQQAQARDLSNGDARRLVTDAEKQLGDLDDLNQGKMTTAERNAGEAYDNARNVLIAAVTISLLLAIGAGVWISMTISRGLGRAGNLAQAVAGGDLTQTIENPSQDEIGDLIGHVNTMVDKLRGVVSEAMSAAENVSAGSQELSASSEELSQGATEQASSTEEASASMEEMAANIKQNADNASQTEKIARQSASDAQLSGEAVGRAVDAMQT
ncbi:MAG TPA: methyl-accepting chemotaxis protein, partial [Aliidongia sp.]|nr:methyl-accepting chemotaxis protein [Aliidongia sp.]